MNKLIMYLLLSTYLACASGNGKTADVQSDTDSIEFVVDDHIDYCAQQAKKTITAYDDNGLLPRNILNGETEWNYVKYSDWTSGFWPGSLWYLYEMTEDEYWKEQAEKFTSYLEPLSRESARDHDLGFQVYNSFGHGYRLENYPEYKEVILKTADTLATLFNPNVGTILSWPRSVPNMEWPKHNTIMDNMINLELMFWAAKNGDNKALYDMAVQHAQTTMENHFRDDYTSYHVVIYDQNTGERVKRVTHQGYEDESMWARGQAWAIYGYTMVYRETGDEKFLDFAQKVSDAFLDRLPEDHIPYWDFQAPNIPDAPKDASAAAIVSSALLELSTLLSDESKSDYYFTKAEMMLKELSTDKYQSLNKNPSFLLHSTGHHPNGSEIDASINYADYYYIEALSRYKKLVG